MPSRIRKFLQRLDEKRRSAIAEVIARMEAGDFSGLDIIKLGGAENEYRVRIGKVRIRFFMNANKQAVITNVDWRGDTTYR